MQFHYTVFTLYETLYIEYYSNALNDMCCIMQINLKGKK